jgi:hypothetical protein
VKGRHTETLVSPWEVFNWGHSGASALGPVGKAKELGSGELTLGVNVPAVGLGTKTGADKFTDLVVDAVVEVA